MRKIFPSFTGLLQLLKYDRVTQDDLDNGIFCFGCVRDHCMHPEKQEDPHSNEVNWLRLPPAEANAIHRRLVDAVLKAEGEGRVAWRTGQGHMSYSLINQVIVPLGYAPLQGRDYHYSYPSLTDVVEESGQALQVMWQVR